MKSIRNVFIGQHKAFKSYSPANYVEDGEILPGKRGLRHRYRVCSGRHEVPEPWLNYAPLKKMLNSAVGKNWDSFQSRFLARFGRGFQAREALQHMRDRIALNTSMHDGEVIVADAWRGVVPVSRSTFDYFVHPVTRKVLRAFDVAGSMARRTSSRNSNKPLVVRLSHTAQLHQIDGIWYEITLHALKDVQNSADSVDCILKRHACYIAKFELRNLYGTDEMLGKAKRQLNHVELKRHGLINRNAT